MNCIIRFCDAHSGFVQAAVTILLVIVTFLYVALIKRGLDEEKKRDERDKQEEKKRDERKKRRALQAIITELSLALKAVDFKRAVRLLNEGYKLHFWALLDTKVTPKNLWRIGDAYLSIERYNVLLSAGELDAHLADVAKRNVTLAIEAFETDPALKKLVTIPDIELWNEADREDKKV